MHWALELLLFFTHSAQWLAADGMKSIRMKFQERFVVFHRKCKMIYYKESIYDLGQSRKLSYVCLPVLTNLTG
jgi:hypothetical protein